MRPVSGHQEVPLPTLIGRRDRDRPLVYLTFGTAFGTVDRLRQTIAGLSSLPVDVLVATGPTVSAAELGHVPPNIVVESWVPQGDLLPHVDLVVSHGGSGTVLGALATGLPHLMLPQGADQFGNARDITALGAGRQILPADRTALSIADAARALLDDDR